MGAEGKFYAIAISQALGLVSQLNVVTELFPIPDHLVSNGFQNSGLARVDAGDANHAQAVVLFDHLPPVGGVAEQGSTGRRAQHGFQVAGGPLAIMTQAGLQFIGQRFALIQGLCQGFGLWQGIGCGKRKLLEIVSRRQVVSVPVELEKVSEFRFGRRVNDDAVE